MNEKCEKRGGKKAKHHKDLTPLNHQLLVEIGNAFTTFLEKSEMEETDN